MECKVKMYGVGRRQDRTVRKLLELCLLTAMARPLSRTPTMGRFFECAPNTPLPLFCFRDGTRGPLWPSFRGGESSLTGPKWLPW